MFTSLSERIRDTTEVYPAKKGWGAGRGSKVWAVALTSKSR